MATRVDVLEQVRALLARCGFAVSERCSVRPTSFDVVARRDDRLLLVKVLGNADALAERVASELRTLAKFLNASPIVIAERAGAGDLEDGVVYSHRSVPVVTLGTLADFLTQNMAPMAYASPGGLYVHLRSEALRMIRIQRSLSLGALAQAAGVSRRAIQMYEEGMRATIDAALRLEEFLAESLVEPIDPFRSFARAPAPASAAATAGPRPDELEGAVLQMLRSVGFEVFATRQGPFSAITRRTESTILTSVERRDGAEEARTRFLGRVGAVVEAKTMYIVNRETSRTDVAGTPVVRRGELEKLRDPDELVDLLDKRRRRASE